MQKNEIQLGDIQRILLGNAPGEFLIEVFIRTAFTFWLLLLIGRWLGKRMAGQLTITEMSVMLTLGAIVAPAMQIPERGILITVIVLFAILLFQRGVNSLTFKNKRLELLTQGKATLLVEDGVMQIKDMNKARITHQQLFANLRQNDIKSLGEVEAVYLEACGLISIYKAPEPKPGLPILPPDDDSILKQISKKADAVSCCNCGLTLNNNAGSCKNCHQNVWPAAVVIK